MISVNRRELLKAGAGTLVTAALARSWLVWGFEAASETHSLEGGTLEGIIPFIGGDEPLFDTPFDEGLDGRLVTDLSNLSPENLVTPNEKFYIRTRYPIGIDPDQPWSVALAGLGSEPRTIEADELVRRSEPMGQIVLECSGNNRSLRQFGLLSNAEWAGVSLDTLLEDLSPPEAATGLRITGYDNHARPRGASIPGASWIFTLNDLSAHGAFLATHMNGAPLPKDHGFPVRLIVPRWYGCCCIKWVNRIEFIDETAAATSHMKEFYSRTHQSARHELARDYAPAVMDHAAMPVRVERWRVGRKQRYRVVGIMWGGDEPRRDLLIRFQDSEDYVPVSHCDGQGRNQTWGMWWHEWRPKKKDRYDITLRIADPSVQTRRLDREYYMRSVRITKV